MIKRYLLVLFTTKLVAVHSVKKCNVCLSFVSVALYVRNCVWDGDLTSVVALSTATLTRTPYLLLIHAISQSAYHVSKAQSTKSCRYGPRG